MGGRGGGEKGAAAIPPEARKVVESLKEVVAFSEDEIYAALVDCDMDPNEAISRLISDDSFQKVKSKREKKKESGSQRVSNNSSYGSTSGAKCLVASSPIQINSNDYAATDSKPLQKKNDGRKAVSTISTVGCGMTANDSNQRPAPLSGSDSVKAVQGIDQVDNISYPSQPPLGFQHSWLGAPAGLSMADIVRLGRPHGTPSSISTLSTDAIQSHMSHNAFISNTSNYDSKHYPATVLPSEANEELQSSQDIASKVIETCHEPGIASGQHLSLDDWSLAEQSPGGTNQAFTEHSSASYSNQAALCTSHVAVGSYQGRQLSIVRLLDGTDDQTLLTGCIESAAVFDGPIQAGNSGSHQSQRPAYEHHDFEDVSVEPSSMAADLQQLNLHREHDTTSSEGIPAVIIPDRLQPKNPDCLYLSFGTFGSGNSGPNSGPLTSKPQRSNLEIALTETNVSLVDYLDARKTEYYNSGRLTSISNDSVAPRTGRSTANVDMISNSQSELIRNNQLDSVFGNHHHFPSVSSSEFSNTMQLDVAAYTNSQANSRLQNLGSVSRGLNSGVFPSPQFSPQNWSATSISMGERHYQHVHLPSYSHPTHLSLHANMFGHSSLPQSFHSTPFAAFQQPHSGASAFCQSPAALNRAGIEHTLPQFESRNSANRLPQSAVVRSGNRCFGSSSTISRSFRQNTSAVSANTAVAVEEAFGSQNRGGYHLLPHQREILLDRGACLQGMPSAASYVGFHGQNQHRLSQHGQPYAQLPPQGYQSIQHPRAGISQDYQHHLIEGCLDDSEDPQSQPNLGWQHRY